MTPFTIRNRDGDAVDGRMSKERALVWLKRQDGYVKMPATVLRWYTPGSPLICYKLTMFDRGPYQFTRHAGWERRGAELRLPARPKEFVALAALLER